jgi:hypothetical protein
MGMMNRAERNEYLSVLIGGKWETQEPSSPLIFASNSGESSCESSHWPISENTEMCVARVAVPSVIER